MTGVRNLMAVVDGIDALWSPHVVGEVNDYDIKVANVAGDFAEHAHDDTADPASFAPGKAAVVSRGRRDAPSM
jgi:hypothetical protein